jgi:hypothetical protein
MSNPTSGPTLEQWEAWKKETDDRISIIRSQQRMNEYVYDWKCGTISDESPVGRFFRYLGLITLAEEQMDPLDRIIQRMNSRGE